jgi:hypothetical protein
MPENSESTPKTLGGRSRTILYAVLAVVLVGHPTDIVEGFYLSPGGISVFVAFPLALLSSGYLILHVFRVLTSRGDLEWWSTGPAIALLLVFWGLPIVPGWVPRLAGYYLRVKIIADVPAIVRWAESYPGPKTRSETQSSSEWNSIPTADLPNTILSMGRDASYRSRDHAVMIFNGSGLTGHWGITVRRGIGTESEADSGWKVNEDAFVWDRE